MIKLKHLIVLTAVVGVSLNFMQIIFVLENNNKLLESLDLLKYFTIQSNILVAVYFALISMKRFENSVVVQKLFGTVLLSIFFTFIVFFSYLEWIYDSVGLDTPASLLNHYITPFLVILYYFRNRNIYQFEYKDIRLWLIYPVAYLLFLLLFGVITNDYIYVFFQVSEVGILGLLIALVILISFFLILSFLLVKILSKNKMTRDI